MSSYNLNYDTITIILNYLSVKDVISFSLAVKEFNIVDNEYWKRRAYNNFSFNYEVFYKLTNSKGIYKYKGSFINYILDNYYENDYNYPIDILTVLYYGKPSMSINDYFISLVAKGDYLIIEELLQNPELNTEYINVNSCVICTPRYNNNVFAVPLREGYYKTFDVLMKSRKFIFLHHRNITNSEYGENNLHLLYYTLQTDIITPNMFIQILDNARYFGRFSNNEIFESEYDLTSLYHHCVKNQDIKDIIEREFPQYF